MQGGRAGQGWSLFLRAGALVALFGLPCAGCGGTKPSSASPARANRLVIGVRGDVGSFNIYTATNAFTQEIVDLLYLKLAEEGDDFRDHPPTFRPALAQSWELSPDRTLLTLHLDPKARWSDGRSVTSEDVLFSHRAASDAAVGWVGRDVKEFVADAQAPDPRTVVYRFSHVYPYQLMDAVEGNILPSHVTGKVPLAEWPKTAFLEAPVTDGPFRLARYERGALIELVRNQDYLRAPLPALDSVVFRIIPEESTLVNELIAGGIDVMENVPADAVSRVESGGRLHVVRVGELAYTFVCWNTSRPLFSDPRVRRALTMAIDRDAIIEGLLGGTGHPASSPIPSMLWAHHTGLRPLPHDPGKARALLAEAGFQAGRGGDLLTRDGKPFRFELETSQESGLRARVAEMVAAQLRRIGVEAVVRPLEFGAFIQGHEKHDFDAFVGSWRESTKVDLKSIFHSSGTRGGYNYGLYVNPELDAVIDRARAETDPESARRLWWRAQEIIAADQPYTFLFERDRFHAAPKDLLGFEPSPRTAYAGLEQWHWADGRAP